jgi:hypothetical protein
LGAAIRCAQHGDVASDAVQPCGAVDPFPFDGRLAFELQIEFDKERDSGLHVVNDDADAVHP